MFLVPKISSRGMLDCFNCRKNGHYVCRYSTRGDQNSKKSTSEVISTSTHVGKQKTLVSELTKEAVQDVEVVAKCTLP